jgi:preprotein translocase subunit SecE
MAKTEKVEEKQIEKKEAKKEVKAAPKSAPARRASHNEKPNFFVRTYNSLRKYFQETIGELRKVHWPTREEAWFLTRIVIIVVVIMSILLGGLDYIFSQAIAALIQ